MDSPQLSPAHNEVPAPTPVPPGALLDEPMPVALGAGAPRALGEPRFDADVYRLVLFIVAAHGHPREAAKALFAARDDALRHDTELLSYVLRVATPAHCFLGGSTLFLRAVARGDVGRALELLDACPTAVARAALLQAGDAHGAPPLALAGTADMALFLLGEGAVALAAGDDGEADVFDAVVRAGRLGVLEVLLESLGSEQARAERLVRVNARGVTLLARAQPKARDQADVDHVTERHDPALFRAILVIVAARGHTREVAKVLVATPYLRHAWVSPLNVELRGYVQSVRSCFLGGTTLFECAVALGNVDRARELLRERPTPAARAALLAAASPHSAPPLALAGTADMARFLLEEGAVLQAAGGGGGATDVFDTVVRAGRLGVLEVLLESLGSDQARRERLARVDARGATLLACAQHKARDQADADHTVQHHDPALFREILRIVAARGHTREAAKVLVATPFLRHDARLLGYVRRVASPARCFHGSSTLFLRAVARGDVGRAQELLRACRSSAARVALLAVGDAHGALPLALAGTADMVWFLLGAGALVQPTGGGATDVFDAVVPAGRLVVLVELLDSLGSHQARVERLARVDAAGLTLLWHARKRSIAQALLDAGATLPVPLPAAARAADDEGSLEEEHASDDAFGACSLASPAFSSYRDDESDDETGDEPPDNLFAGWDVLDALIPEVTDSEGGEQGEGGEQVDVLASWVALRGGDSERDDRVDDAPAPHNVGLVYDWMSQLHSSWYPPSLASLTKEQRRRRVNLADEDGVTLLMRTARQPEGNDNSSELMDLLMAGADVYAVDDKGRDAFDYASLEHDESEMGCDAFHIEQLLFSPGSKRLRRLRANRRDPLGRTFLMRARSPQVAESLVRAGASAWGVDLDGHDALWHALAQRDGWGVYAVVPTVVKALGASERRRMRVNAADDSGLTPPMCATNWEAVRALTKAGADPLAVDSDGHDAFWHAADLDDEFEGVALELLKGVPQESQRRRIREKYELVEYR